MDRALTTDLRYAGFWSRLKAGLIDFAVFLPITPLSLWSLGEAPRVAAAVYVASSGLYFAYAIIGHAVWGQTLGKRLVGIWVRNVTGGPAGWARAWRRGAVDIALGTLSAAAYVAVLARIPAAEFDALGWVEVQERYNAIRPWWAATAEYLYWAWLASEAVTVLFNDRRRALHDYVAGTVVTHVRPASPLSPRPVPPGRRALVWGNGAVSGAAAMTSTLCVLAAAAAGDGQVSEATARIGLFVIAGCAAAVAVAFAFAARALHTASPRRWLAQGVAVGVAVVLTLPFLL